MRRRPILGIITQTVNTWATSSGSVIISEDIDGAGLNGSSLVHNSTAGYIINASSMMIVINGRAMHAIMSQILEFCEYIVNCLNFWVRCFAKSLSS